MWGLLGCGALAALVLVVSPLVLVVAAGSWWGMWDPPGAWWFERATVAFAWIWALVLVVAVAAIAGLFMVRRSG